jgi:hypothetical protein
VDNKQAVNIIAKLTILLKKFKNAQVLISDLKEKFKICLKSFKDSGDLMEMEFSFDHRKHLYKF